MKGDKDLLLEIFLAEIEDGVDKEVIVYSHADKRKPPNAIVYRHVDTVKGFEQAGLLEIIDSNRHVDEYAPNMVTPPFYKVRLIAKKIQLACGKEKTLLSASAKKLPTDVKWDTSDKRRYVLRFSNDGDLTFDDVHTPNAIYFRILIENHGNPVYHTEVMKIEELVEAVKKKEAKMKKKSKGNPVTSTQIQSLVRTLKDKIANASLTPRIEIINEHKGGYYLLIVKPRKKS